MGKIVQKESGIETVGALIKSLQRFDPELPIEVGIDETAVVYFDEPVFGVDRDNIGRVVIEGD